MSNEPVQTAEGWPTTLLSVPVCSLVWAVSLYRVLKAHPQLWYCICTCVKPSMSSEPVQGTEGSPTALELYLYLCVAWYEQWARTGYWRLTHRSGIVSVPVWSLVWAVSLYRVLKAHPQLWYCICTCVKPGMSSEPVQGTEGWPQLWYCICTCV
jgi:hypothetical protein